MEEINRTVALIDALLLDEVASWTLNTDTKETLARERDRLITFRRREYGQ